MNPDEMPLNEARRKGMFVQPNELPPGIPTPELADMWFISFKTVAEKVLATGSPVDLSTVLMLEAPKVVEPHTLAMVEFDKLRGRIIAQKLFGMGINPVYQRALDRAGPQEEWHVLISWGASSLVTAMNPPPDGEQGSHPEGARGHACTLAKQALEIVERLQATEKPNEEATKRASMAAANIKALAHAILGELRAARHAISGQTWWPCDTSNASTYIATAAQISNLTWLETSILGAIAGMEARNSRLAAKPLSPHAVNNLSLAREQHDVALIATIVSQIGGVASVFKWLYTQAALSPDILPSFGAFGLEVCGGKPWHQALCKLFRMPENALRQAPPRR